jgi:uncharacterized protein YtpQ (UPF0354 family)
MAHLLSYLQLFAAPMHHLILPAADVIIKCRGSAYKVVTPIKNRPNYQDLVLMCLVSTFVSSCSGPVAEENKQPAAIKIKIDQPRQPDILDTQKGLPGNIFDDRLESKTLTATEFTSLYGDAIQSAIPQSRVVIKSPLSLAVRVDPKDRHDCKIDLNKIWQACKDKPGHREELVTPKVKGFYSLINFVNQPLAGEEFIDKIVPLVRGERFIQALGGNRPAAKNNLFYDKLFGDLYIVYAVDDPLMIKVLTQDYLVNYAKTQRELLRAISLRNLERMLARKITLRADGPIYIVTVGGNYEPSLILLDNLVQNLAGRVKGKLVVALPTHDSLFICGDETPGALAKLKEVTDRALVKSKLPISDKLYVLDQGHWKVFQAFDS